MDNEVSVEYIPPHLDNLTDEEDIDENLPHSHDATDLFEIITLGNNLNDVLH